MINLTDFAVSFESWNENLVGLVNSDTNFGLHVCIDGQRQLLVHFVFLEHFPFFCCSLAVVVRAIFKIVFADQ